MPARDHRVYFVAKSGLQYREIGHTAAVFGQTRPETLRKLLKHIACLRRRNYAIRIGGQQQAVSDEVIGRFRDGIDIPLVIAIPLLQRQPRVAARGAFALGIGEGKKAAGQITEIALAKSCCPIVPRDVRANRGAYGD
jgi:hypothetical protein